MDSSGPHPNPNGAMATPNQSNFMFLESKFWTKIVPGPKCRPGDPKSDPGLKNLPPGMKKQKMRAEKPCRIQWSVFQTEPHVASYGQNPFGGFGLRIPGALLWQPFCFWDHGAKGDHGTKGQRAQHNPFFVIFVGGVGRGLTSGVILWGGAPGPPRK